jgi:hypothetical protein
MRPWIGNVQQFHRALETITSYISYTACLPDAAESHIRRLRGCKSGCSSTYIAFIAN